MGLKKVLAERKTPIVKKWFDKVVETYPTDTARFLKRQKDPFGNPVGSTTFEALTRIFEELLKEAPDSEALQTAADPIIRIRAVQTMFSPAQAAGFPYFLKTIIREELESQLSDVQLLEALLAFDLEIDKLSLVTFNIYTKCRETVYQLKTNLERERLYKAFSRAGLVHEIPEDGPDLEEK
ncbi:RsbRD N-terminal domain-containing protein [Desulfococcus multivorans]|jgi:hypothetical protein|uniref:RsbT co-antagonist protein RsbRD, N-terminal domain containing protein n=1 Tax=Desulfococcus multivorans DSM 2059 TaxID=1121405 RepID=S7V9C6_DESML|nr:RsbRD N-terminal domain-containing protein [Desulfococcus multivorans]AOY60342.1 conserved uncharacterized protein [Desulfococcus multivorans]AQV02446.1 hypothetical protein B2D07_17855 [Desulfococcus multivorans]EPR41128.1 RsbT co-antagonist protein RsbRD, N-terminal domain containing protein [Desulfococcus multivorans DSM 2059]MDX9818567.1 RsbRD N-terminal domain-containing protein [Desulfococcus multivorans]SJZ59312.1 RsbT co-antagonist protein rsbRD N-terminal domain-containing protein 